MSGINNYLWKPKATDSHFARLAHLVEQLMKKIKCKFCDKEYLIKGISMHQSRCNENPNRKTPSQKFLDAMRTKSERGTHKNQYSDPYHNALPGAIYANFALNKTNLTEKIVSWRLMVCPL